MTEQLVKTGYVLRGPVPLEKLGDRYGTYVATQQLVAGFRLPARVTLSEAGLGPCAIRPIVTEGVVMRAVDADPVASLAVLAEDFVSCLGEKHVYVSAGDGLRSAKTQDIGKDCVYGELPLPAGIFISIRKGPFRMLKDYQIRDDTMLLRIDALIGRRAEIGIYR